MDTTIYVSTTSDLELATRLYKGCWVYEIHAMPNFIDLNGSLKHYSHSPEQKEFSVIGGIYWSQVVAWTKNSRENQGTKSLEPSEYLWQLE
ncbi:hypothetical protein QQS21_009492, partial [Conoideocrella luteorostrata]